MVVLSVGLLLVVPIWWALGSRSIAENQEVEAAVAMGIA